MKGVLSVRLDSNAPRRSTLECQNEAGRPGAISGPAASLFHLTTTDVGLSRQLSVAQPSARTSCSSRSKLRKFYLKHYPWINLALNAFHQFLCTFPTVELPNNIQPPPTSSESNSHGFPSYIFVNEPAGSIYFHLQKRCLN
jgi:hypothetical protein